MKLQAFPDLAPIERSCMACRRKDRADRLLLDLSDHDRWQAFYCVPCVTKGYAEKLAKQRARAAKKAAKNDWRDRGAEHLEEAPPLSP